MFRKFIIFLFTISYSLSLFANTTHLLTSNEALAQKGIEHIVVILLENTSAKHALQQPFMQAIRHKGAYLDKYYAIIHPSQPNYIALVSGSLHGVITNSNVSLKSKHLGDLLLAKGKDWRAYAEDYPGHCFMGAFHEGYARKHVPFLSFTNVQQDNALCGKVLPAEAFWNDLANHHLPAFAFYTPNLKNDGHDTGIAFADKWLEKTFGPVFSNPDIMHDTLFIITFDEDDYSQFNKVYTLLLGAGIKPGVVSKTWYTHYHLLRTIEEIFQLGTLNRFDKLASPINDVWAN